MSGPLAVVFLRRATREIERIDDWWRKHRPSSPDLFVIELDEVLAALAVMPTLGVSANARRMSGVRRFPLQRVGYQLYYRVQGETLEVLAVWHGARGGGPGL